ncbi:syndecan precursor [Strongylocentrotus purpuratus]|uniref:Syndecan n=1 Tax=Strongylocentrotus purpuratus TaxID=7668 RepID=A0A7M6UF11_STRPU|nr:syndecan precursor [Strongylocentrotus purpuratus]|eukprot:NP_001118233.1 syndecan precursor [Strongylocentrotus purpuratus]
MRVLLLCGALLVALVGTCSGEVNDEIYIDDATEGSPDMLAEIEMSSGDGPNGVVGPTTDDEDLVEGSGTSNNLEDPDVSFSPTTRLTTINNNIQENVGKDQSTISNNLGGMYDQENEVRYKNDNDALNGGPNDVNEEPQNFFKMIFENPAILAGMVGAVVLILLTVVLLFLFVIYRIKKKDEGSYSLDEPHKVKDPTAYWKDTKEFYA